MNHRIRSQINQRLPETVGQVARSYFFGVLGVLLGFAALIFYFGLLAALQ